MVIGGMKVAVDSSAIATIMKWVAKEQPDDPEIVQAVKTIAADALADMRVQIQAQQKELEEAWQELGSTKGQRNEDHPTDREQLQTPDGG